MDMYWTQIVVGLIAGAYEGIGSGPIRHKHDTVIVWNGRRVATHQRGDRLGVERDADGRLRASYS